MDKQTRANLLKDEYIMLQQFYEDIDQKGLNIKGWSITATIASFGAAMIYEHREAYLIAAGASLLFWYLEAYWRGLGYFFSRRIIQIEEAMRDEEELEEMSPLQVYRVWSKEYDRGGGKTLRYMFKLSTMLPHVIVLIAAVVMFFVG
jgi:hypothetical protein